MLHIKQLHIKRGQGEQCFQVVLEQLDLKRGQIKAITGPSGSGKSTLLESIGLLLEPYTLASYQLGEPAIQLAGWPSMPEKKIARLRAKKIGFVLQSGGLIPYLTIQQNLELPRQLLAKPTSTPVVTQAIEKLQIGHLLSKKPAALSIGERQRVAFIRAIAHEPQLLLADEPTAALDPLHARNLFSLFTDLIKELNISALVVSHDWSLVEKFGLERVHAQMSPGVCHFV